MSLVEQLETFVQNLDFDFQEWVVFTMHERHRIKELTHEILAIVNDAFFRVDWENETPLQKTIRTRNLKELVAQIKEDGLNSYQQEVLESILSIVKR
jgi:hypothetical protein